MIKTFTFLLASSCLVSFAQSMNWAYSFKNSVVQESFTDIASNGADKFAVIGTGNSGVSMDPINLSVNYKSQGNFIAYYDNSANVKWVKSTLGYAFGLKMNASGDLFVLGASSSKTYVQKYNSDGDLLWTGEAAVDGNPTEVEELSDGRIIVAGRVDVNSVVTLGNSSSVNLDKGAYILEFSSAGVLLNAFGISVPQAAQYIYVYDLISDANNNIYLCGQLDGIADFNLGANTAQNSMTNAYDAYVVKYNSSFELQWFKKFGDKNSPAGWDKARALAVDANENIYVGGEFTWTTDFDPENPNTSEIQSDDNTQVPSAYVLQYNNAGVLSWVVKIGNDNQTNLADYASVSVSDIILNNNKLQVLLEGYGVVDMDPSSNNIYQNSGVVSSPSLFFGEYTTAMDYISSFSIGANTNSSIATSVGFEPLSNQSFCVAGAFQKKIDFDPSSAEYFLQCDVNGAFYGFDNDLYLAKYQFSGTNSVSEINSEAILAYPNPFTNFIQFGNQVNSVEWYDLQGKLILNQVPVNGVVSTDNIQSGVYTLKLLNNNSVIGYKKVVKP